MSNVKSSDFFAYRDHSHLLSSLCACSCCTQTVTESDIHETEDAHSMQGSGSQRSLGNRKFFGDRGKVAASSGDIGKSESGPLSIALDARASICGIDGKDNRSESLTDEDGEQAVLAFECNDSHQKIYIPLPGQTTVDPEATKGTASCRRMVTSGCAICLCHFDPEEKITWSANPNCPHVFHGDCILHWYLAVGRKAQKKRLRIHPNMADEEILSTICEFQTNCPCCRQSFCHGVTRTDASTSSTVSESDSDEEPLSGEQSADDIETGSAGDSSPE
jgi:hypothetical protein